MGLCGLCEGAALGAAFQEAPKHVIGLVFKAFKFKSTRKKLRSALKHVDPVIQKVILLNQELGRTEEEIDGLLVDVQEAQKILDALSNVPCWQCCCLPWKQVKLQEALDKVERSNVELRNARDTLEILSRVREGSHGQQLRSRFKPPPKPDLLVGIGLDKPSSLFNNFKRELLQTSTSVLVLTGLAGYGKTTLATLLCWDRDIIDKFGENILFLTVSKTPNLKTMVESLYQHFRCVMPDLDLADDKRIISYLKNLPDKIMKSPMMLVLDDVWPGSESLVEAFQVQNLSHYKILVTSRFNILGFEDVCRVEPLCPDDSVTLLRHLALPKIDERSPLSIEDQEKLDMISQIANACYGSPLVLELVGGSLKRERLNVWKQKTKKLSKGGPIVEHNELRSMFQKYLDDGLQDKPNIKECFMDLSLFPEDQKIPVAALIDIWTERQNKRTDDDDDDDDLDSTQKLDEAKAVDIIYNLTDSHLANLVIRRETGIDDYYNHHFLKQHDLYREVVISEASQEPFKQRERLIFVDINENNWSQRKQQNAVARTLSISTSKMLTPELSNIFSAEVLEVLVINLLTKKYSFPEFMRKMKELKVLIVTNYDDYYCSELNNFELLDSLCGLKRIRLERVSVTTIGKWHNLRKLSLYNCNTKEAFESDNGPISEAVPNLVELCIDYCKNLVKLSSALCSITTIKKISITRCMAFSALPLDIGNLVNLKTLRLSSCAVLEELPASVGKLLQLSFLDISDCVSLHSLPEEIGDLLKLEELHMTGCYICKMPSSVTKLENLRSVRCNEEIATIWKEEFKPRLPTLRIMEEEIDHSLFI